MATVQGLRPIPQPDPDFLTEHLMDVNATTPAQQLMEVAKVYGPIFQLPIPGRDLSGVVEAVGHGVTALAKRQG